MAAAPLRTAVLVPGRSYGADAPLLRYAGAAAAARRARIRALSWSPPPEFGPPRPAPAGVQAAWVHDRVAPVLDDETMPGGRPLVVGKSLGSYAAPLAARRGLPAVWLTPLLNDEQVVAALRATRAPFLLVGGTADRPYWDGAIARYLTPHVCEVDSADHEMHVPGPLAASAAVLGVVATAVERFLDTAVWAR